MAIYADKKDGKPTGRWSVEVVLNGRRLRTRTDTHEQALAKESEFRERLAAGDVQAEERTDSRGKPTTLSALVERAKGPLWKGSTHGAASESKLRKIIKLIGDVKLSAGPTTEDVDSLIEQLQAKGFAGGTINRYLSALHAPLEWGHASGRGYVKTLPEIDWQDEDEGRIRVLTLAEETALLAKLRSYGDDVAERVACYVEAALDTGCRPSELLEAGRRRVADDNWLHLLKTKNGAQRSIYLTPRARHVLESGTLDGLGRQSVNYWWNRARGDLGLAKDEDFVPYACRHTCATRLVGKGVNLRIVQKWLGHKRIETTLRYTHVSDVMIQQAAMVLGGQPVLVAIQGSYPSLSKEGEMAEGDEQVAALALAQEVA